MAYLDTTMSSPICAKCKNKLTAHTNEYGRSMVIQPCEHCIDDKRKSLVSWKDGFKQGFKDGLEANANLFVD